MVTLEQTEMLAKLRAITEYMNWDGDKVERDEPRKYKSYFHPMRLDTNLTYTWHALQFGYDNMTEVVWSTHMYLLLSNDGRFYVGLADDYKKLKTYI
eukprot:scaffold118165_cov43-Cyclotella_meneghiniana.AAC.2